MARLNPDDFDRVTKLVAEDEGITFDEAAGVLRTYRLQVVTDAASCTSEAWQAALLTVANAGKRAMHGGVQVLLAEDPVCVCGPCAGHPLSLALTALGAQLIDNAERDVPTVVLGTPLAAEALERAVFATADQWTLRISPTPGEPLNGASTLAAVGAAAVAVSECFQFLRGFPVASERTIRLSLWWPGADPTSKEGRGPAIAELPPALWLLGLGHLGQAFAWLLTLLPYPHDVARRLVLQDDDRLSKANRATSMLDTRGCIGQLKTRMVSEAMERCGWTTTLVERRFLGGRLRHPQDPPVLLGGLDSPRARSMLSEADFPLLMDAGLGGGPDGYLEMTVRRLPGRRTSQAIWGSPAPARAPNLDAPAYRSLEEQYGEGCGVEQLAGRTVATAFVGVTAAVLVLASVLRELHGGPCLDVIDLSLRDPRETIALEYPLGKPPRMSGVAVRT